MGLMGPMRPMGPIKLAPGPLPCFGLGSPMKIYRLSETQVIRAPIERCWDFFSNPKNLALITPEALDFQILGELPAAIYPGLMIEYRVRPVLGLPLVWLTEITHAEAPHYFVDEQRTGPYRLWHHEHFFSAMPDGRTEIRDVVTYALPFGPFGQIAHALFVRRQLQHIFDHRRQAIAKIFPG